MLLDCQRKFSSILDELKDNLNELKTKFCKRESDLHISRNVNDKLSDELVVLEQKCHANEQCQAFLLKWRIRTLKKKRWRFWMQSTSLLTPIWLRSAIVFPQEAPPKKLFKTKPPKDSRWTRKS